MLVCFQHVWTADVVFTYWCVPVDCLASASRNLIYHRASDQRPDGRVQIIIGFKGSISQYCPRWSSFYTESLFLSRWRDAAQTWFVWLFLLVAQSQTNPKRFFAFFLTTHPLPSLVNPPGPAGVVTWLGSETCVVCAGAAGTRWAPAGTPWTASGASPPARAPPLEQKMCGRYPRCCTRNLPDAQLMGKTHTTQRFTVPGTRSPRHKTLVTA